MHYRSILFIMGCITFVEGVFLILPTIVALIYGESQVYSFLLSIIICFIVSILLIFSRPKKLVFNEKESLVTVSLGWILLSLFGSFPFIFSGDIPNFTNAFFETISGFTTTGSSILENVEKMSYSCLFWRSFTHWIGGMGVLVFLLAVIPMVARGDSNGEHMNLMRAESPGPNVNKLVPKVRTTALILYLIYFILTVVEFIFLYIFRMPLFDAVTTAFSTAGTGGFGIKVDSMASYSPAIQWTVTIFMALFGVNFSAFFFIFLGKFKSFFRMTEVKGYFTFIFISIVVIMLNSYNVKMPFEYNLRTASFQVTSIISSTGFSTVDFNLWNSTSKFILILLMFSGACAGSTGGGIKVSRFLIMFKSIKNQMLEVIHPGTVRKIRFDDKVIDENTVKGISVFFVTFMSILAGSIFIISFDNYDFETNFTAVLSSICNIGPGLSKVGPMENFSKFSTLSKYVLMFDMIAGRLELYPLLSLFYYRIWKENIFKRVNSKKVNN